MGSSAAAGSLNRSDSEVDRAPQPPPPIRKPEVRKTEKKTSNGVENAFFALSIVATILGIAGYSTAGLAGVFHNSLTAARVTFGVGLGIFLLLGIKKLCCAPESPAEKAEKIANLKLKIAAHEKWLQDAQKDLPRTTQSLISIFKEYDPSITPENEKKLITFIQVSMKDIVVKLENGRSLNEAWNIWEREGMGANFMSQANIELCSKKLLFAGEGLLDHPQTMARVKRWNEILKRHSGYSNDLFKNGQAQIRLARLPGIIAQMKQQLRSLDPTAETSAPETNQQGHRTARESDQQQDAGASESDQQQ